LRDSVVIIVDEKNFDRSARHRSGYYRVDYPHVVADAGYFSLVCSKRDRLEH
jgi:hypothetical protein